MTKEEFFLLIPAIIYGVALVDLLKVFKGKLNYWELTVWGSVMMFYIVIVWLELFAKLELVSANKWFYLMTIGKAVIVAQIAAVITPEDKDIDHKDYFFIVRRTIFILISLLVLVNFALQEFFYNDERPMLIRATLFIATASNAIWDKVWLRVIGAVVISAILVNILIGL